MAKDCAPEFFPKTDPFQGPVELILKPRETKQLGSKQRLSGRVMDPGGQPISGAVVNFDFYYTEDGGGCGGACEGVDPLAVTDSAGRFLLTTEKPFVSMSVQVEARGFAKRKFKKLASGREHSMRVNEGATVTGRVQKNGQALKGVSIGLVSVDRSEDFTGDYVIATNDEGQFALVNIPPNQGYYVYGEMNSLRAHGAIAARLLQVKADGSTLELGDLPVTPGLRLTGEVLLSDGKPVPPNTKVALSREDAWDAVSAEVDAQGRFEIAGLYPGHVSIWTRIPGYTASTKNRSLDRLNGNSLIGRLERDINGLKLLMEPGEFQRPGRGKSGFDASTAYPRDKLLRGAE